MSLVTPRDILYNQLSVTPLSQVMPDQIWGQTFLVPSRGVTYLVVEFFWSFRWSSEDWVTYTDW
jgi:hypothetical protein